MLCYFYHLFCCSQSFLSVYAQVFGFRFNMCLPCPGTSQNLYTIVRILSDIRSTFTIQFTELCRSTEKFRRVNYLTSLKIFLLVKQLRRSVVLQIAMREKRVQVAATLSSINLRPIFLPSRHHSETFSSRDD